MSVSTGKLPVSTGKSREHSRGSLRGDPQCVLHRQSLNLRGHFRGHLRVHPRAHFREHFRERVRGSNFAVRVLCACLIRRKTPESCKRNPLNDSTYNTFMRVMILKRMVGRD